MNGIKQTTLMKKLTRYPKKAHYMTVVLFLISVLMLIPFKSEAKISASIDNVTLEKKPLGIRLKILGYSSYKAVQVDKQEVMIAFKDAIIADKALDELKKDKSFIESIRITDLPNNVIAIFITTKKDLLNIESVWNDEERSLLVKLNPEKPEPSSDSEKSELEKRRRPPLKPNYKGNIDDIIYAVDEHECSKANAITIALTLAKKSMWEETYDTLTKYINTTDDLRCKRIAAFFRGYAFFKSNLRNDPQMNLEAADMLLDAVNDYPGSELMPYGFASLGVINLALNNEPEAMAYFRLLLDKYDNYSGRPQILYEMGKIYLKEKKLKEAISVLKANIFEHPDSIYYTEVKLELGKALFEVNDFKESLHMLTEVVDKDNRKMFESPDTLTYMGNALYEIGKYKEARNAYSRVYNYFPENESNDFILTRIGDTYIDEKQPEKAKKIYQLVIDKYPGSNGFVISSMRMAEFQNDRTAREDIYRMVINDYPTNPMALEALLNMATMSYKEGEYTKSIEFIDELLKKKPKNIRSEAILVLKKSYESLFGDYIDKNEYPMILTSFEKQKNRFRRLDSPLIYLYVGKAYLNGHLYEQAADILANSYMLYSGRTKPPELVYSLGYALKESNENDKALKIFNEYLELYPNDENVINAYDNLGELYLQRKEYQKAVSHFDIAISKAKTVERKTDLMLKKVEGFRRMERLADAPKLIKEVISLLVPSQEKNKNAIFTAYRKLGMVYEDLGLYLKAAFAYDDAIKFLGKERESEFADLRFKLGEAYQKGNAPDKALKIFEEIVNTDDSVWGRLAEEKLKSMELEQILKNT